MNKKVKKYLLKYSLEFLVIVMGISVSFWLSNYQESVDNAEKEIQVYNDLFKRDSKSKLCNSNKKKSSGII